MIKNRQECCYDRLGGNVITVDGQECAKIPTVTDNKDLLVKCKKPIKGTTVKMTTTKNVAINIRGF